MEPVHKRARRVRKETKEKEGSLTPEIHDEERKAGNVGDGLAVALPAVAAKDRVALDSTQKALLVENMIRGCKIQEGDGAKQIVQTLETCFKSDRVVRRVNECDDLVQQPRVHGTALCNSFGGSPRLSNISVMPEHMQRHKWDLCSAVASPPPPIPAHGGWPSM